jgi:hypothetical protein
LNSKKLVSKTKTPSERAKKTMKRALEFRRIIKRKQRYLNNYLMMNLEKRKKLVRSYFKEINKENFSCFSDEHGNPIEIEQFKASGEIILNALKKQKPYKTGLFYVYEIKGLTEIGLYGATHKGIIFIDSSLSKLSKPTKQKVIVHEKTAGFLRVLQEKTGNYLIPKEIDKIINERVFKTQMREDKKRTQNLTPKSKLIKKILENPNSPPAQKEWALKENRKL